MSSLSALKQSVLAKKKAGKAKAADEPAETASLDELLDDAASLEDQAERYAMSGTKARNRLESAWDIYAGKILAAGFGWTVLDRSPPKRTLPDEVLAFDAIYNAARVAELLATFNDPPTLPISHRLDMLEVALALADIALQLAYSSPNSSHTERIVRLSNIADAHYNVAQGLRSLSDELGSLPAGFAQQGIVPLAAGRGLPFALQPKQKVSGSHSRPQMLKAAAEHLEKVFAAQEERLALEAQERANMLASGSLQTEEEFETSPGSPAPTASSDGGNEEEEGTVIEPLTPASLVDTLLTLFSTNTDLLSLVLSAPEPNTSDAEHLASQVTAISAKTRAMLNSVAQAAEKSALESSLALHEAQFGLLIPAQRAAAQKALLDLINGLERSYPPNLDLLLPSLADLSDSLMEDRADGIAVDSSMVLRLLERAHALRPRDIGIATGLGDARVLFTPASLEPLSPSDLEAYRAALGDYSKALAVLEIDVSKLVAPAAPQRGTRQPGKQTASTDPRTLPLLDRILLLTQHVDRNVFKILLASSVYRELGGSARRFVDGPKDSFDEELAPLWTHVGGAADWVRAELQMQ